MANNGHGEVMDTISYQQDEQTTQTNAASGRKLAIVMGGGGGKGGAHLGVLATLESLAIPIDMFVGTSIGGVVATLYAAGYTIQEIAQSFAATSIWRLMERDPVGMGMLGLKRFRSSLEDMLGDCTFEDLQISCAIVAADLVTGAQVVIDSGPVVDALMGTVALPGIFPPFQKDDMLLADGGIINNLPVEIARQRGADKVIAIDLGSVCGDFQISSLAAGPRAFLNLLPNVPLTIANRGLAILIGELTRYQLAANPPDLLICPQVEHIGMLEFVRVAEGEAAGEAAAEAMTEQLLEIREWRTQGQNFIPFHPLIARTAGVHLHKAA